MTVADAAPNNSGGSLDGRAVLILQRLWVVANALADAFEANGAQILLSTNSRSGMALADHPNLSAAILDSGSRELCRQLEARGIPFLFYTGRIGSTTNSPQRPLFGSLRLQKSRGP
jgi:hypothetical protein